VSGPDPFDVDPRRRARADDPETSHDAADLDRRTHSRRTLEAIAAVGPCTSEEAARAAGLTHAQAWRRIPELIEAGLVRVHVDEAGEIVRRRQSSGSDGRLYELEDGTPADRPLRLFEL